MPIITHRQHYVPQRYLAKWLNGTELNVLNLKTKKVRQYGTNAICFIWDYYELKQLTNDEKKFFELLYYNAPTILKDRINEILSLHDYEYKVEFSNKEIEESVSKIFKNYYDEIKQQDFIQGGEEFISNIEKDLSNDLWDKLYQMNSDFIHDEQNRVDFYSYIVAQMYRVPKSKQLLNKFMQEIKTKIDFDISADKIFPYFVIFQSMILSVKLSNKNNYKITYMTRNNHSKISFITSDNPVVNICEYFDNEGNPLDYELYWPLSPDLAMLITTNQNKTNQCIEEMDVIKFNQLIVNNASEYIISYDKESINKDLYQI